MKETLDLNDLMYELAIKVRLLELRLNADKTAGLSKNEELFLELVDKAGTERVSNIASQLRGLSQSMISIIIKNLSDNKQLISKKDDPADKRQTLITLTDHGKETLSAIRDVKLKLYNAIRTALNTKPVEEEIICKAIQRALQFFEDKLLSDRIEAKF